MFPSRRTGSRGARLALGASAAIALLLGLSARVQAQEPASSAESEAQAAFRDGVAAARAGEWQRAHEAFDRAYALSPRPVVLFNLAGAALQTGRLLAAEAGYRQFLQDTSGEVSGASTERRAAAESQLAELQMRIPRVRIEPQGLRPDDEIELDGRVLRWPGERELRVDPGAHQLRFTRAGAELGRSDFEVDELQLRTVGWVAPAAPAPLAPAPPLAVRAEEAPPARTRPIWLSPWLWAAAAVLLAGGAATALTLRDRPRPFVGNAGPGFVEVP